MPAQWTSAILMNEQDIKASLKSFILNEYLPGEDPAALTDTTPLMTTGILDSIAVLKVVNFLESEFGITIEPHGGEPKYIVGYGPACEFKKGSLRQVGCGITTRAGTRYCEEPIRIGRLNSN